MNRYLMSIFGALALLFQPLPLPGFWWYEEEPPTEPLVDEGKKYDGPKIHVESDGFGWRAGVLTPTGGWKVSVDFVLEAKEGEPVPAYITLWRPGPDEMVTQAFTAHTVEFGVDASEELELFARVMRDGSQDDLPYQRVCQGKESDEAAVEEVLEEQIEGEEQ